MIFERFLHLVPARERTKATDETLRFWHAIFYWVLENGEADVADYDDFVTQCRKEKVISEAAIGRHLARMATCGLLEAHRMRRKADTGTLMLSRMMWLTGPTLPSTFIRYTLPGKSPSLRLRRGERMWAEMRRDLRSKETTDEFARLGIDNPFSLQKESAS